MIHAAKKSPWARAVIAVIFFLYFLLNTGCVRFPAPANSAVPPTGSGGGNSPAPQPTTVNISGAITPAGNNSGVTVSLSGESSSTTTTDSAGNYSFSGLASGNYTLTPSKSGFTFSPSHREVEANDSDVTETNFTANPDSLKPSGPIVINGQNGTVIQGLKITSSAGDCVTINNSTNITVQNSEIGPCKGNAIKITGGSGINVYDSYIHPETLSPGCCDHNDGIFATNAPHNLTIQGNVIAYGESNIEVQGGTSVTVVGNFLLNPRGPKPRGNNFQCWNNCSGVTVKDNYAMSSLDTHQYLFPEAQEDSINIGASSDFLIQNNFITGGHSPSGCGIMADTNSNGGKVNQNRLLDTGQCGIGMVDGSHSASSNYVYNRIPIKNGGNTAIYVAHFGKGSFCGPMKVTSNVADALQSNGAHSGWWTAKNCGAIPLDSNVFGKQAEPRLSAPGVFTPPLVPPEPKNCVAISPYSTQTSASACIP